MKAKTWISIALGIILVLSVGVSLFGIGKLLNQAIRMAFGIYPCDYVYKPAPVKDGDYDEPKCVPNKERPLEDVAEGISMFLPGLPLAYLAYKGMKKI